MLRNSMTDDDLDERNEWPVLPVGGVARDRHGLCRNARPAKIPCRERRKSVCRFVKGSPSGGMKHLGDGGSDDAAWKDVRPSKREEIRGVIERLSKPSKIRSIFGSGLTEHAKSMEDPWT